MWIESIKPNSPRSPFKKGDEGEFRIVSVRR
jgi:hypothetical protein